MAAVLPDLSVTISQRRWSCVLDPTLALSYYGLALVKRLRQVMEVWVVRELWNILDNTHFYLQDPASLLPNREHGKARPEDRQAVVSALRGWEQIRMETDPGGLGVCWVGDSPSESFLPENQDPGILWRFERLSASLDRRVTGSGSLDAAFRDTVALAVAEGQGFVLSHLPETDGTEIPPAICNVISEWRIPCGMLDPSSSLVLLERDYLLRLLIQAGVAGLCWAGLRPVVLHIVAPMAAALNRPPAEEYEFTDDGPARPEPPSSEPELGDVWQGARGFWYPLNGA